MEDMLKTRNFSCPSSYMCLEEEECVNHLLVHCRWISRFGIYLSLMEVSWVHPSNGEIWQWLEEKNEEELVLVIWNMIPLAIWWAIQKQRNRCIVQDKALSFQDFKHYFLRLLYSWSVGLNGDKFVNLMGFVDCIMDESLRA